MGLIIISGIVAIIGIILCIISDRGYPTTKGFIGSALAIFSGGFFLVSLCILIDLQGSFDEEISDYYALKEVIEYNRSSMSEFERVGVIELIHKKNCTINDHKIWYDNFWVGVYFSKEIGELEYLK